MRLAALQIEFAAGIYRPAPSVRMASMLGIELAEPVVLAVTRLSVRLALSVSAVVAEHRCLITHQRQRLSQLVAADPIRS